MDPKLDALRLCARGCAERPLPALNVELPFLRAHHEQLKAATEWLRPPRRSAATIYQSYIGPRLEDHFLQHFIDEPFSTFAPAVPLFVHWTEAEVSVLPRLLREDRMERNASILSFLLPLLRMDVLYLAITSSYLPSADDWRRRGINLLVASSKGAPDAQIVLPHLFNYQLPGFDRRGLPIWTGSKSAGRAVGRRLSSWVFENYERYQSGEAPLGEACGNGSRPRFQHQLGFVGSLATHARRREMHEMLSRRFPHKYGHTGLPPCLMCQDASMPHGLSPCWRVHMLATNLNLCPVGTAPVSYRLYESLQQGSVPVVIHDDRGLYAPYEGTRADVRDGSFAWVVHFDELERLVDSTLASHVHSHEVTKRRARILQLRDSHFTPAGVMRQLRGWLGSPHLPNSSDLRCRCQHKSSERAPAVSSAAVLPSATATVDDAPRGVESGHTRSGGVESGHTRSDHGGCASRHPLLWNALEALQNARSGAPYVAYACQDTESCGGMGDQLAGLVSAAAYAVATNRTLVIDSPRLAIGFGMPRKRAISSECEKTVRCSGQAVCPALEDEQLAVASASLRLQKLNRAYLCRWMSAPSWLQVRFASLGIGKMTDLFGLAGCLLRHALQPRHALRSATEHVLSQARRWVAVHQRTGILDAQAGYGNWHAESTVWSKARKEFVPLVDSAAEKRTAYELAQCAVKARNASGSTRGPSIVPAGALVLSDSDAFASLVAEQLRALNHSRQDRGGKWAVVEASPFGRACHSDLNRSTGESNSSTRVVEIRCDFETQAAWLALASSQAMVVHLNNDWQAPARLESGFIRSALWYAQLPPSRLFVGRARKSRSCDASAAEPWLGREPTRLDRTQEGNWICS